MTIPSTAENVLRPIGGAADFAKILLLTLFFVLGVGGLYVSFVQAAAVPLFLPLIFIAVAGFGFYKIYAQNAALYIDQGSMVLTRFNKPLRIELNTLADVQWGYFMGGSLRDFRIIMTSNNTDNNLAIFWRVIPPFTAVQIKAFVRQVREKMGLPPEGDEMSKEKVLEAWQRRAAVMGMRSGI